MTAALAARRAARTLAADASPDDAYRDASVLVRHVLGWDMAGWLARQHDELPEHAQADLDRLVDRRAAGEPVAYLVGEKEFYGRPFAVTPAVLIPRPETELLVDRALAAIDRDRRTRDAVPAFRVVDVGTGSGCVAITLAAERAGLHVAATDISAEALAVAEANAGRHDVSDRVTCVHAGLTGAMTGVDLVVSNPPYVAESDRTAVMRDVVAFEPHAALFAGDDGLSVIEALVPDAARALGPGGTLLIEIGLGQATAVARLCRDTGFVEVTLFRDLAGIERVVEARCAS